MNRWACALGCVGLVTSVGCARLLGDPSTRSAYPVEIEITSDPGHGVAGVELANEHATIATTDARGKAVLTLHGEEGDVVPLHVRCPDNFASPPQPIEIALRHLAPGSAPPHFAARCAPQSRTVVIALRAEAGPHLPVLHLGREVARTDASGAAHALLTVKPQETVSLMIDTKGVAALRPENPVLTFVAKDQDDVVVLEQRFDIDKRSTARRGSPVRGPRRL